MAGSNSLVPGLPDLGLVGLPSASGRRDGSRRLCRQTGGRAGSGMGNYAIGDLATGLNDLRSEAGRRLFITYRPLITYRPQSLIVESGEADIGRASCDVCPSCS